MDKKPRGRQKNVTGQANNVYKRGKGLNTGPVGSQNGYAGKQNAPGQSASGGQRQTTRGGSRAPIIIAVLALLLGGGGIGGLSSILGGGGGTETYYTPSSQSQSYSTASNGGLASLSGGGATVSSGWTDTSAQQSQGTVNTSVVSGARNKRTVIKGGNQDTVTVMVYMCGTDLESQNGMGTSDLSEMASATLGSNVHVIVYTGGCRQWKNDIISNSYNQIYEVMQGGLKRLVDNNGTGAMTSPTTLSGFIKWCKENYPANRNELILWDHGSGSVSGYGYDEKNARSGSMTLAGLNQALSAGGVTFDFIGFDACLMATAETALMLDPYADYLIASEETEPGVGWYYTNWLTKLSSNTSMATVDIGKNIVDDFVNVCAQRCRGQKTTLSVIDLAELSATLPSKLSGFSKSVSSLISNKEYKQVSDARNATREFARSNRIDMVDLADLGTKVGTKEGAEMAGAIKSAVKYNRTSSDISNAYGLSIYFPYRSTKQVDMAVSTYNAIGMDSDYAKCIKQFASLETSGQIAAGGSSSPYSSISGNFSTGSSSMGSLDSELIGQLLSGFLGGGYGRISGLTDSNIEYYSERAMSESDTIQYIADNQLDAGSLVWTESGGEYTMTLPEAQWDLVHSVDLNMFYDDGSGYIDLGLDNIYSFRGNTLVADTSKTWLAINGQVVAYYHTDTEDDGTNYTITGRVPCMINGVRAELILVFDNQNPTGYIAGARYIYTNGETETVAKGIEALDPADVIDFVCDYYSYSGSYQNSYYLGDQITVGDGLTISDVELGDASVVMTYMFTDIYNQEYWSSPING